MRKLIVLLLCGFVQSSIGSRIRFEQPLQPLQPIQSIQPLHEPVYRQEPNFRNDGPIHMEPVFKREHIFPRNTLMHAEQLLNQPLRNDPIFSSSQIPQPQGGMPNEGFFPAERAIQNGPIIQTEPFIPPELRREAVLRREPIFRRDPFIRAEPMIPNDRMFQNPQVIREEPIFRSPPNYIMLSQCQCPEPHDLRQMPPPNQLFQIQAPIQPQSTVHRVSCPKSIMKAPVYHQMISFPRMQRLVRNEFRPMGENIQFNPLSPPPPPQGPTQQELNNFNSEPIQFQTNFSNQVAPSENSSEPPVTVRNVPQMPNPLNLAQMSSIC